MADGLDILHAEAADMQEQLSKAARGRVPVHHEGKLNTFVAVLSLDLSFLLPRLDATSLNYVPVTQAASFMNGNRISLMCIFSFNRRRKPGQRKLQYAFPPTGSALDL